MKVLVASPVCNRAWIIREFLACLENLDKGEHQVDYYFIENGSTDETLAILWDHCDNKDGWTVGCMELQEPVYDRGESPVESLNRLAKVRDKLRTLAIAGDYDYLLSVDSDILVPTNLLVDLLAHEQHFVAATVANPAYPLFSAVNAHRYIPATGGPLGNKARWTRWVYSGEGLHEVGSTGAVFLADREALEKGNYLFLEEPGMEDLPEDVRFSLSCKAQGICEYLDESLRCWHCWDQSFLDTYQTQLSGDLSSDEAIESLVSL